MREELVAEIRRKKTGSPRKKILKIQEEGVEEEGEKNGWKEGGEIMCRRRGRFVVFYGEQLFLLPARGRRPSRRLPRQPGKFSGPGRKERRPPGN